MRIIHLSRYLVLIVLLNLYFLTNTYSDPNGDTGGGSTTSFSSEAAEIAANGYEYNIDPLQADKDNDRYRLSNYKVKISKFRPHVPCVCVRAITADQLFIPLKTEDEFKSFLRWADTPEGQTKVEVTWCHNGTAGGGDFDSHSGCEGGGCT